MLDRSIWPAGWKAPTRAPASPTCRSRPEPGDSLGVFVEPRVDPRRASCTSLATTSCSSTRSTGREIGRREWGKPALTRENFVPFLYLLHYSLHIPELWGIDRWGIWLMGGIALVWTLDCFVGFYLTLPGRVRTSQHTAHRRSAVESDGDLIDDEPNGESTGRDGSWWRRWKPAWRVKWSGSGRRINFDLHRAGGLWLWAFLFVLALSGMSLNLYTEVRQPLVALVSEFTPSPYDLRPPQPKEQPDRSPRVVCATWSSAHARKGTRRGWTAPVGAVSDTRSCTACSPRTSSSPVATTARRVWSARALLRQRGWPLPRRPPCPGRARLAISFCSCSSRCTPAGSPVCPGGIFISFMGLFVALLSATGVVIWWQKRSASMLIASRQPVRRSVARPLSGS